MIYFAHPYVHTVYSHQTHAHTHYIIIIMYMYVFLDDDHPFPHDAVLKTSNCRDTQIAGSDFCQALDQLGITHKNSSNITGFEKQIITSVNDGLYTTIV